MLCICEYVSSIHILYPPYLPLPSHSPSPPLTPGLSIRPSFEAHCDRKRLNPITRLPEPYFPSWARLPRYLTGVAVASMAIGGVLIAIVGVIAYRGAVRLALWRLGKSDSEEVRYEWY